MALPLFQGKPPPRFLSNVIVQLTEKGVIGDIPHDPGNSAPEDHDNPLHHDRRDSDPDNLSAPASGPDDRGRLWRGTVACQWICCRGRDVRSW